MRLPKDSAVNSAFTIHPTACVSTSAKVGLGVQIGPYAIVEEDVQIGDHSKLSSHVILRRGVRIEAKVTIDSFAVLGGDPQDIHFDPSISSGVHIGEETIIREGVTIHRSTKKNGETLVGKKSFLMANSHVAHDCQVGESVILANNVMLAGFVIIEDFCFLGGGAAMHQFVRVGNGSMVGGHGSISRNVPPFSTVSGRDEIHGLNLVGMKRRNFAKTIIADLKRCYRAVYWQPGGPKKNAERARTENLATSCEGRAFLAFFEDDPHHRGFAHHAQ